ncbi:MAG: DUF2804 family protein [Polyangiaceae bacterium]|nr:DUF2804 family protein [Polyangiaceae bacterium]
MPEPTVPTAESQPKQRVLTPPPSDVIDPATHFPLVGSYEGPLPHVDYGLLDKPLWFRLAREKAWYYVALASPELFVGVAMLRFGYVASTFAFVFERGAASGPSGHFLADRSQLGPPFAARYRGDDGISFQLLNVAARFERAPGAGAFDLEFRFNDFHIHARISGALTPPPVSAVAALGDGLVQATEKRALLNVAGEVEVAGRRFSLDEAMAGFDRSHGYLPRRTVWRWVYALGYTEAGRRIAINLVDGFVGESECVIWVDDKVYPVGEARLVFDPNRPLQQWKVKTTCGCIDLTFDPGDIHSEYQIWGL